MILPIYKLHVTVSTSEYGYGWLGPSAMGPCHVRRDKNAIRSHFPRHLADRSSSFHLVLLASSARIIPFLPARLPSSQPQKSFPAVSLFKSSSVLHRQSSASCGSSFPWRASQILSPITGKNLKPCPDPPVAMKRFLCRGWYVMRKSPDGLHGGGNPNNQNGFSRGASSENGER